MEDKVKPERIHQKIGGSRIYYEGVGNGDVISKEDIDVLDENDSTVIGTGILYLIKFHDNSTKYLLYNN